MQWAPHNAQSFLLLKARDDWIGSARLDARREGYWYSPDGDQVRRQVQNKSIYYMDAAAVDKLERMMLQDYDVSFADGRFEPLLSTARVPRCFPSCVTFRNALVGRSFHRLSASTTR